MLFDYFNLSFKNLKHRGVRSWLTLLGIFIGVVAVVALISLGNGLKIAVSGQFGISSTEVITITAEGVNAGPPGSGVVDPLNVDDLKAVEKLNNIQKVIRRNLPVGKIEYNGVVVFGYAMNIPDGKDRDFVYEQAGFEIEKGRFLKDGDTNKVVLGYNFYDNKVGLGKEVITGKTILIQDEKFKVIGITKRQGSFIFDNIVLINEKPLEDLMDYGNEVDVIVVQVKDENLISKTKEDIEKLLRERRDVEIGEEDFEVTTPDAALKTVNSILNGVRAFVVIVALISILIGAIGIVNTMTTSVLERKKEIGVMKAIGATNKQIFLQFFVESSLLGFVGGAVGAIVGSLIGYAGTVALNNFLGTSINPEISFSLIFFSLLGSFIIGGLAGIWPAMNAAKQNPVEALQG